VERFHGLHGSDGLFLLGCLWAAYLLSVWVLGFGSGMLARVRGRWRLVVLGGLPLLGGLCYITFGLIASAVGLVSVLGLALMRAQEGALKTGLYKDVVNTDRRATVISAVMTVQNGMAAAVMLLAGRVVADHGLEAAMILIGGWHVLIGGVAVAVLGFSRFMGR